MTRRAVVSLATFIPASALVTAGFWTAAAVDAPSVHGAGRTSSGRPAISVTIAPTAVGGSTIFTVGARETLANSELDGRCPACSVPSPPPAPDVEHVVVVSVDGLNPQSISMLGRRGAPTFDDLVIDGVSTLNARTTVEQTTTLPNHASMLSGRKVSSPGGHGVTFNQDNGSTIHAGAGGYVASIFDVVHDNGGSTALYAGKSKFDFFERSWNAVNGAPDVTGTDNGTDKIDFYQVGNSRTNLAALLAQLASPTPTTFSLLHFADPDNAGHASGFMSAEYLEAVSEVDRHIGEIVDAISKEPDLAERTILIVSTDHGGSAFGHARASMAANYTVPLFVWGAWAAPGGDLYALNPDRRDPTAAQPPYGEGVPPIRTAEIANLAADLLELSAVPGSVFNTDQSLSLDGVAR